MLLKKLRAKGKAKADKKSGRIAAEGVVRIQVSSDNKQAMMLEVNSETDFVGRDENFLKFVNAVAATALEAKMEDVAAVSQLVMGQDNISIEEARQALVAKVGENISIRRLAFIDAANPIGTYLHSNRIGVY